MSCRATWNYTVPCCCQYRSTRFATYVHGRSVHSNGRPHLADALIDRGFVDSVGEALERYLGRQGEAFVPMKRLPAETVIETIHRAEGLASLAHPGRIRTSTQHVERLVGTLVESGLDAIEVWYPYGTIESAAYADITASDALEMAADYNLLATGGLDCHGPGSGKFRMGEIRLPRPAFDELQSEAGAR